MLIVATSFGKDSTALVLGLKDKGIEFKMLFTPTGDELPTLVTHIRQVVSLTGAELLTPTNKTIFDYINAWNMLPSQKSRWCTRVLKIEPCIAWFKRNPGHTLAVGLRADELARKGLYSELIETTFPLQEWGWGLKEVQEYLKEKGITVPERTDCGCCPYQRQYDWYRLWQEFPEKYQEYVDLEEKTGHTFHSPTQYEPRKDGTYKWDWTLKGLRTQFENGEIPKPRKTSEDACRVCRL